LGAATASERFRELQHPVRRALTLAIVGLLLAAAPFPCSAAAIDPEDELKAAVVLSFLRYAEWNSQPGANSPIVVGVFGRPAFGDALRRTIDGKSVNNRAIRVIDVKSAADTQRCQVVAFAATRSPELQTAVEAAQTAHALTIGDTRDFLQLGGAVNLLEIDGRMSFEVSLDALERAGVTISSKLLRFGLIRGYPKAGA